MAEQFFEEKLLSNDPEKLNELKHWLFEENIRICIKQKEIEDIRDKYIKEREQAQKELNEIHLRAVRERKRLKDEEEFFSKKMDILKNGFAELEADRRRLERERIAFEGEKSAHNASRDSVVYENLAGTFFSGVNNLLALKKRYRDLLKIFHPDNACGDNEMVLLINREYERIKKDMEYNFKNAN